MQTTDKETERIIDVVMYVASLSQSAYRFAKKQAPFDFEDTATAEFLMARYLPFIEDGDVDYKVAHQSFLQNMFECGWEYGTIEDFSNRVHPDLITYDQLPYENKEMYGYTAALISSAKSFYLSLKADLEEEFMSSFSPDLQRKSITGFSRINVNH